MGPGMFDNFTSVAVVGFLALCISIPLAAWKLVEIVVWIVRHVSVS